MCLLFVRFVRLVASRCDFELLLFEIGVWFASCDGVSTNIDCVMPLGHRSAICRNSTNALIDSPFFCSVVRRVGTDTSVSFSKNRARKSFSRSTHFLIERQEASWTIQRQPSWGCRRINELWWHHLILHSLFGIWSRTYVGSANLCRRRREDSMP